MRRVLLIDLYALPEYDISLALGYLKACADADPAVKAAWTVDLLHLPDATAKPPAPCAPRVAAPFGFPNAASKPHPESRTARPNTPAPAF